MVTRVDKFLGGLGIDATDKFEVQSNATVTVGNGSSTGNVHIGGTVGIGTSTPGAKLQIRNTTDNTPALKVISQNTGGWGLEIDSHSAGSESDLVFTANAVEAGQDSISYTMESGGYWRWITGATSRYTGTAGGTERMRLTDAGYLGIGTNNPSTELEVNGTVTATAFSGDGSSLTGVNPTTHLAVGTYAMLMYYETSGTALSADDTIAGSSLRYGVTPSSHSFIPSASDSVAFTQSAFFSSSDTGGSTAGTACSGTWRLMGMDVPGRTTFTRTDSSGESPVPTTYYAWFLGLFVRTA